MLAAALALAAAAADITIVDVDDRVHHAVRVDWIREGGTLLVGFHTADGRRDLMPAENVVEIRFQDLHPPAQFAAADVRFVLTNGDALLGRIAGPGRKPDSVRLDSRTLGPVELEFLHGARIEFPANRTRIPANAENPRGEDAFFTAGGNRPRGFLTELHPDRAVYADFHDPDLTLPVPTADLALILFARRDAPPDPQGLFSILTLKDGSRLRGLIQEIQDGVLTVTTPYGHSFRILTGEIAGLHFRNGRVVYLSDLEPSEQSEDANYIRGLEPSPSDLEFPMRRDESVKGAPLSIRGTRYTKGLGVHARSELAYRLAGKFTAFRAAIGVDDVAAGLGNVVFEVHVDGKKRFDSGEVTGEDPPRTIQVDVAGANELRLIVRFGADGNTGDSADWAGARLIR